MKGAKCTTGMVGQALLVIGGLNWGLVGLGGFLEKDLNVVNLILGQWPVVEWIVYLLVGVAAVHGVISWTKCCAGGCGDGMCGVGGGECKKCGGPCMCKKEVCEGCGMSEGKCKCKSM